VAADGLSLGSLVGDLFGLELGPLLGSWFGGILGLLLGLEVVSDVGLLDGEGLGEPFGGALPSVVGG
jgi:hypothetical protein